MNIVIQAGGYGSRLESLTWNKPKCLVSVNGLPILFYTLRQWPDAKFFIIADYKADVLRRYLKIFASEYDITIIECHEKGTAAGIGDAAKLIPAGESFLVMWSDLVPVDFVFPAEQKNYIGLSDSFECRWSFADGKFEKIASRECGVAGCFLFENNSVLKDIPDRGEFVAWLKDQPIEFTPMVLKGWKEIGTMLAFNENSQPVICRPFNELRFQKGTVVKSWKDEYGYELAQKETAWYKYVSDLKFSHIPEIYSYMPLTMNKITGHNIFELDYLVHSQKEIILHDIVKALQTLHSLTAPVSADNDDSRETYLTKTFQRLNKIHNLVPFANNDFLRINKRYYRNVFAMQDELNAAVEEILPDEFHLIHGDCTFSNIMYDTFNRKALLIDPRGYFGKSRFFGDRDYDWAKLYYSIVGNYDQFNRKKFSLKIFENSVELAIKSSGWEGMEEQFFDLLPNVNKRKIKLLHAIIWLSLTTYAWDDYDSICGAFYRGVMLLDEVIE